MRTDQTRQNRRPTKRRRRRRRKPVRLEEKPNNAHRLAREFLTINGRDPQGQLTLRHWGGGWWRYEQNRYRELSSEELRVEVTQTVEALFHQWHAVDRRGHVLTVTTNLVSNVVNAVKSLSDVSLPGSVGSPWRNSFMM